MGFQDWLVEQSNALVSVLEQYLQTGSAVAVVVVFAAGVLTSFTPCVYPMIPVTVTFIGGSSGGNRRRAVVLSAVYVLGMALIYSSLGMIVALTGSTFGRITRSPWIYGSVGVLMVLFGLMMLGWINIPIPGFVANVQSKGVQKGGYFGALLMGMAAGFVAAPCTAPVLFALLAFVAKSGQVLWGGLLLFSFALGLGFLLMLLGIFSGLLTSLPAAGKWMDHIKKAFGFGMFLVAIYFFWQTWKIANGMV